MAGESEPTPSPLEPYRTRFELLTERMIGTAAQPVRFDWRRTDAQVGVVGGPMLELNSFQTQRLGAELRFVWGDLLAHVSLHGVWTMGSPSTEVLAMTPYRQTG